MQQHSPWDLQVRPLLVLAFRLIQGLILNYAVALA